MPTILLADDDEALRALLVRRLLAAGWTVREASDGTQALRSARESPPDVAALDVNMPGLDGYAVCRMLRVDARTRDVAVILLTGALEPESPRRDPPPDAWISKPFPLADFIVKTTGLLKTRVRGMEDARERCDACGTEFLPGGGRFRTSDGTLCPDCHEAAPRSAERDRTLPPQNSP
ncbi:MAG: response regulator [Elusimicrobia bacterium]|nr:response regulator [Elusimicrobiota bacterium]